MREYSLKVWDTDKKKFFKLISFQSNQKIWPKYFCEDLSSLSDTLTCWLSIIWIFFEVFFEFEIIAFELVALDTRFYWERILVIGCQYVNKQPQDFRYYWKRVFLVDFFSEWSKNMRKLLPCRFKESFGLFNMLPVHKCSDTGLFRHLSNPAFCSLQFQKEITSEAHLFFQSIRNYM